MRRSLVALSLCGAALAGCGSGVKPLPANCTAGARAVLAALRTAPAAVALADGTRLSTCIERARSDAEIQNVGGIFNAAAASLSRQLARSDPSALELGYLIGAAQRGARHTAGIHAELVRRLEQTASLDGTSPARRAAFARGSRAGARAG